MKDLGRLAVEGRARRNVGRRVVTRGGRREIVGSSTQLAR